MNDPTPDTEPTTFHGAAGVTITVDLISLLTDARLLGEDYDGDPVHAHPFLDQLVRASAERIAKDVLTKEMRSQITQQVEQQVTAAVSAALDAPVQKTDRWGSTQGEPSTLRAVLADEAAEQVQAWMKGRDGYNGNKFRDFLSREVDRAVQTDLNGLVKEMRATVKSHMEAAAADAIAAAASQVVSAVGRR